MEDQVLMPIEDPVEMGHSLAMLVKQLQKDLYPPLFQEAFERLRYVQRLAELGTVHQVHGFGTFTLRCGTQCGRFSA